MHPLAIFVIAVALLIVLILWLRVNAFLALICAAVTVGLLDANMRPAVVMDEVASSFGDIVGRIGIPIALAAVVGQCLMESGGAERIVRAFARWFGEANSSLAILATGYVLSISVFGDSVFYLLLPLARAMSARTAGGHYVLHVLAIAASTTTHYFVPPTPGPLAAAAILDLDLGIVIAVGLVVAFVASLAGWGYCRWIDGRLGIEFRDAPGSSLSELRRMSTVADDKLPRLVTSLFPIVIPVVLITSGTVVKLLDSGPGTGGLAGFVGDPALALLFSAAACLWVLARNKKLSAGELAAPTEQALLSAGMIILITAGGGTFGSMLLKAGLADAVVNSTADLSISVLVVGFGLSVLLKIAQGSGTVCMITVSSILADVAQSGVLPFHSVYLLMAIGAGSLPGTWMNDSGFWIFRTMTGLTEIETFQTKVAVQIVLGCTALLVVLTASWLLPLK